MTIDPSELHVHHMGFGKHRDVLITRVPVGYLQWMVNISHPQQEWAAAELTRRGSRVPELSVSGHALDRASQHFLKLWKEETRAEIGLHSWLSTRAKLAWDEGELIEQDEDTSEVTHGGIRFLFTTGTVEPVVKTVTPPKGGVKMSSVRPPRPLLTEAAMSQDEGCLNATPFGASTKPPTEKERDESFPAAPTDMTPSDPDPEVVVTRRRVPKRSSKPAPVKPVQKQPGLFPDHKDPFLDDEVPDGCPF